MRAPLLLTLLLAANAWAADVSVAVAANFATPAKSLATTFEKQSGHRALLSTGSTGKFYAQIATGAPFDVLLAADAETPLRLEKEGLVVGGQRFTYALGKLVLWSLGDMVDARGDVLRKQAFRRLSIANPRLAPYGAAAQQVMENLGIWSSSQERLVMGENIAQAYQFVSTGNVEVGFVAYSQIRDPGKPTTGSFWLVPQTLYAPIRQDAVLLARAQGNQAARQFLDFLRGAPAREMIQAYGYELP